MILAAKLIDTQALLNVVWISFVGAVGGTAAFSIAIAGAARFVDLPAGHLRLDLRLRPKSLRSGGRAGGHDVRLFVAQPAGPRPADPGGPADPQGRAAHRELGGLEMAQGRPGHPRPDPGRSRQPCAGRRQISSGRRTQIPQFDSDLIVVKSGGIQPHLEDEQQR